MSETPQSPRSNPSSFAAYLQAGQSTNHDDTQSQTTSEKRVPAHLLDDITSSSTLLCIELGHQVVCWVTDNSAEDTGDVSSSETDSQLLGLAALLTGLGHNIFV